MLLQLDQANGAPLYAVVTDFGCATDLRADMTTPHNPKFDIGGAQLSLPPEIILSIPGFGPENILDYSKSDIFGLGMICYHMLSGDSSASPFGTEDHRHFSAVRYVDLPQCYSPEMRLFVRRLLAPNKAERPSVEDLQSMVAELDVVGDNQGDVIVLA